MGPTKESRRSPTSHGSGSAPVCPSGSDSNWRFLVKSDKYYVTRQTLPPTPQHKPHPHTHSPSPDHRRHKVTNHLARPRTRDHRRTNRLYTEPRHRIRRGRIRICHRRNCRSHHPHSMHPYRTQADNSYTGQRNHRRRRCRDHRRRNPRGHMASCNRLSPRACIRFQESTRRRYTGLRHRSQLAHKCIDKFRSRRLLLCKGRCLRSPWRRRSSRRTPKPSNLPHADTPIPAHTNLSCRAQSRRTGRPLFCPNWSRHTPPAVSGRSRANLGALRYNWGRSREGPAIAQE